MDVLRFILRLPFILLRLAARSLVYLFTLLGFLLRPFTGRIRWAVPGWVTFAGNQLAGYRKYKPPFCSSSEVSYLKFPHSFTAQAPILTAGPA
ncbi:hypothetical protein AB8S10_26560 [Klebsiella pneumoniae]